VQTRFLLGPAGSGKTFRCLAEIRAELLAAPRGAPLILLAPKQATFQLERQLLADENLSGYTRLQIFSFERLADFVLEKLNVPPPPLLSEEGRVMVLRALLARRRGELKIFHASARLSGFVQSLSLVLRELQRHQLLPEKIFDLAQKNNFTPPLKNKLHDLALLLGAYLDWLRENKLQDANCLLDLAADALQKIRESKVENREKEQKLQIHIAGLWLDGFAEMTPQELGFIAALAPACEKLTLAFCLDHEQSAREKNSWLSIWSTVGQTFQNCRERLEALPQSEINLEMLPRNPLQNRFGQNPALQHLEKNWTQPKPFGDSQISKSLRAASCPNPQAEAIFAAREILQFVRAGGRFREVAILLRQLDGYHEVLRRTFSRYEIPFFLDRRESVAHHPLAELTRSALRLLAFDWAHDAWFGALKSGLISDDDAAIDQLENEALAHGWKNKVWLCPLKIDGEEIAWAERLRKKFVAPFLELERNLSSGFELKPTGAQLATALREFWRELNVEEKLQTWSEEINPQSPRVHASVWQQMNSWLDNLSLAFAAETLPLREWLPILDAGLSGLSVGIIPPALDQVLIGTVDRSRNPDLKLALVLGLNETVFPTAPAAGSLLTDADRDELTGEKISLGPRARELLSRERFYGYIACTRARERLVLTCAERDANGRALNCSPFFSQIEKLFPELQVENFSPARDWSAAEHACELLAPLIKVQSSKSKVQSLRELAELPVFESLREELKIFSLASADEKLSPALAEKLFGPALKTSVSRLEQFAACPFKFFVHSGLAAEERQLFELDAREKGSFQHAVLARFHEDLCAEKKRWRDVTPAQARERIGKIAAQLAVDFREGLLQADAPARFTARSLGEALQDFVATIVEWMAHYEFDPQAVELAFGTHENALPAWELDLGEGHRLLFRGVIDRVDLCRTGDGSEALGVVIDYKSGARKLDPILLAHGVQLQLPAYLSVLRQMKNLENIFGIKRLIPAGVFYVNLRGQFSGGKTRDEVLSGVEAARQSAYQHLGRFDLAALAQLDNRKPKEGTQFKFKFTNDGAPYKKGSDGLTSAGFQQLLDGVEKNLVRMGREIFSGEIQIDPYQKGADRACAQCQYQAICRIDPWIHSWRVLRETVVKVQPSA